MERRQYDTSDYLPSQEREIELSLPMTAEDMLTVRGELLELDHYLTDNHILPQHTSMTANGYTRSTGAEQVTTAIVTARGEFSTISATLTKPGASVSFYFNADADTPNRAPIIATYTEYDKVTATQHYSIAETVHCLSHFLPKSESLLRHRAHLTSPEPATLANILQDLTHDFNLTAEQTNIFSYTQQSLEHHRLPFSERSIVFQTVKSDTTPKRSTLAVSSHPVTPTTGELLKDVSYGCQFTFDNVPFSDDSPHIIYGTATGFGKSTNPHFGEQHLRASLRPHHDPQVASEEYRVFFTEASKTLAKSQIPEFIIADDGRLL